MSKSDFAYGCSLRAFGDARLKNFRHVFLGSQAGWAGRAGRPPAGPAGPGRAAGWPDIPDGPSVPFHKSWNGFTPGTERTGKLNGIDHGMERNDLERYILDIYMRGWRLLFQGWVPWA